MKFKEKKTINIVLESLFNTYSLRVPDVKKITKAMVSNNIVSDQSEIILFETIALVIFLTSGTLNE